MKQLTFIIFASIFIAFMSQNSYAEELTDEDRFLLRWLMDYDAACKATFPPPANKGDTAAKFCFCVARTFITGMSPEEYARFIRTKFLPESVHARSSEIRRQCGGK